MRKFKLVREYPGVLINEGEFITDKAGVYFPENGGNGINPKHVENYPEFWQEVKDEFPKIISFRNKCNNVTFNLCENGKYSSTNSSGYFSKEYHLKLDHFEIYQVAVSETEVFTLGDLVNNPNLQRPMPFVITKFYFDCNNKHILCNGECCGNGHVSVMKVEHYTAPKYLFTTNDGVNICVGDFHFSVNKKTLTLADNGVAQIDNSASHKDIWWTFSTKELAEQFILDNKPIYSKKQISDTIEELSIKYRDFPVLLSRKDLEEKLGL